MHPGNYQDLGTTELIQGMISLDVLFDSTFEGGSSNQCDCFFAGILLS